MDSISGLVTAALFHLDLNSYAVSWTSSNGESNGGEGRTPFTIGESPPLVNARVLADAKADHNVRYGTNYGVATPDALFGGMVG